MATTTQTTDSRLDRLNAIYAAAAGHAGYDALKADLDALMAGMDKAATLALARSFQIHSGLTSKKSAAERIARRVLDRRAAWDRTAF